MMAESSNSGWNYAAIAGQWCVNHVAAALNKRATIKELLEAVFSIWSMLRLYNMDKREKWVSLRLAVSLQLYC
jgi:hypothetical protein